jgi:hypothetical protein
VTTDDNSGWIIQHIRDDGSGGYYYRGPGEWMWSPAFALRFPSQDAASLRAMALLETTQIVEYSHG